MERKGILLIVVAIAALIVLNASTYTVREHEQALVTQFGKIQGKAISVPGLHLKMPFVQKIERFDKRWLEWDGARNEIPTRDKKYIWVDSYARWRISDPVRFFERLRSEVRAQSRLDDIIDSEIRNVIASHNLIEIVRSTTRQFEATDDAADSESETAEEQQTRQEEFAPTVGRQKLMDIVLEKASQKMPEYGVELADIRIKRINYVPSVQAKVFERMISERNRIAARFRSEGQGVSAEIKGRIEREVRTIQSEAYREAEEIRGKADAEAAAIYATAYNKNASLYRFVKSLETYKRVIDKDTELVLSSDSAVFKYLSTPDAK